MLRDFYLKTGETRTKLRKSNPQKNKVHKAMFFRHWLTDSAGLWSEKRESEPWGCISLLPGGSFQRTSQGWGTQTELSGLAGLKRARSEIQEGTVARICETENQRDGCYTGEGERERGTHSAVLFIDRPPWSLWLNTDLHRHERKLLNSTMWTS